MAFLESGFGWKALDISGSNGVQMLLAGLLLAVVGVPLNWYIFARLKYQKEFVHSMLARTKKHAS